eukprot:403370093
MPGTLHKDYEQNVQDCSKIVSHFDCGVEGGIFTLQKLESSDEGNCYIQSNQVENISKQIQQNIFKYSGDMSEHRDFPGSNNASQFLRSDDDDDFQISLIDQESLEEASKLENNYSMDSTLRNHQRNISNATILSDRVEIESKSGGNKQHLSYQSHKVSSNNFENLKVQFQPSDSFTGQQNLSFPFKKLDTNSNRRQILPQPSSLARKFNYNAANSNNQEQARVLPKLEPSDSITNQMSILKPTVDFDQLFMSLKKIEDIVESVDNHNINLSKKQQSINQIENFTLISNTKSRDIQLMNFQKHHLDKSTNQNALIPQCPSQTLCDKSSVKMDKKFQTSGFMYLKEDDLNERVNDSQLENINVTLPPAQFGVKRSFAQYKGGQYSYQKSSQIFKCDILGCNKQYSKKTVLETHKRQKHNTNQNYTCPQVGCESLFFDKVSYRSHKRSHAQIKEFSCIKCFKNFTTNGHLRDHIKSVHDKTKDFKCTYHGCTDSFARHSVLIVHMRKHTGERPYKCNQCEKAFTESGNLKVHKKTHNQQNERKYVCKIESCGKSFLNKCQIQTHYLSKKHIKLLGQLPQNELVALNISQEDIEKALQSYEQKPVKNETLVQNQDSTVTQQTESALAVNHKAKCEQTQMKESLQDFLSQQVENLKLKVKIELTQKQNVDQKKVKPSAKQSKKIHKNEQILQDLEDINCSKYSSSNSLALLNNSLQNQSQNSNLLFGLDQDKVYYKFEQQVRSFDQMKLSSIQSSPFKLSSIPNNNTIILESEEAIQENSKRQRLQ